MKPTIQAPAGFRLVTCPSCRYQQLIPELAQENCADCGIILPKA